MNKIRQPSESIILGILLSISGGFMDSYSYICRGEVFANAQTGNILLLGVNLTKGNFAVTFQYLCPFLAFTVGIVISEIIRYKYSKISALHWRQITVFAEAIILLAVGFIPLNMNLIANSLTSLACGIQVESFRKIQGNAIATTMCIGNLRSGTQHFCDFILNKDKDHLKKGLLYYGIILCFVSGAIIGSVTITYFHEKAIFICPVTLFIALVIMFYQKKSIAPEEIQK